MKRLVSVPVVRRWFLPLAAAQKRRRECRCFMRTFYQWLGLQQRVREAVPDVATIALMVARMQAVGSQERDSLGGLVIGEEPSEASPADERVKDPLVILVGHPHDDRFENKIRVHRMVGLPLEKFIDFSEEAKRQEPLAPQGLALAPASPRRSVFLRPSGQPCAAACWRSPASRPP